MSYIAADEAGITESGNLLRDTATISAMRRRSQFQKQKYPQQKPNKDIKFGSDHREGEGGSCL